MRKKFHHMMVGAGVVALTAALRANDSITCRSCHVQSAIKPKRKRGQRQHEEARKSKMTCIDCHYNLVHEEIPPRESFLDLAGQKQ